MPINKQFLKSRPEVKVTFAVERRPRERPSRSCCWGEFQPVAAH